MDEDWDSVLVGTNAPERAPAINRILILTFLLELLQYAHFVFDSRWKLMVAFIIRIYNTLTIELISLETAMTYNSNPIAIAVVLTDLFSIASNFSSGMKQCSDQGFCLLHRRRSCMSFL